MLFLNRNDRRNLVGEAWKFHLLSIHYFHWFVFFALAWLQRFNVGSGQKVMLAENKEVENSQQKNATC